MDKPVLMVAYHYPPAQASGTQRALGFSRHLPGFGWRPLILSCHPMAHEHRDDSLSDAIPAGVPVVRAFALDAARHLAIRGRYSRIFALPDRWSSWMVSAIPAGLMMIRKYRPKVIWSTYPIATSLVIGRFLSRWSGLPWVVDLRDPMVIGRHPVDPDIYKIFMRLEKNCVSLCDRIVVTTPGIKDLLAERYPELSAEKWQVITNGYDEEIFRDPEIVKKMGSPGASPKSDTIVTLLHSGTLYTGREERNPSTLLDVLVDLKDKGFITGFDNLANDKIRLKIVFRATGHDSEIKVMIASRKLGDVVILEPALPYKESLLEMTQVDGLLLLQGEAFDRLIPAKLFEYLRSGRPVFGLVGRGGDSRRIMDRCGVRYWAPLEDRESVSKNLMGFLEGVVAGGVVGSERELVQMYSRREGARALAVLLDDVVARREKPARDIGSQIVLQP